MKILILLVLIGAAASQKFDKTKNETEGAGRIINGTKVSITRHPHQVDFERCGGSIIGKKWILTAAHCKETLSGVYVGSDRHKSGTYYKTKRVYVHPFYFKPKPNFDFALVELFEELRYDSNVAPIMLGTEDDIKKGQMAVTTGFGLISYPGPTSAYLLEVDVPIFDHALCKRNYIPYNKTITDVMVCAGYPEGAKDSCAGDSGGPLVLNKKLIGVTSFGEQCAKPNLPGVYARVPRVRRWIKKITGL